MNESHILIFISLVAAVISGAHAETETEGVCLNGSCGLMKTLSNGNTIPLVGMGVGNLPHEILSDVINSNLNNNSYQLIDTARKSGNEAEIAMAISNAEIDADEENVIHVVTKVWYTHLGYDRTTISVDDSMKDLPGHLNIRLHILLHWPRCYDNIPWMDCEKEEENLVEWIKFAGPPPHNDKDNAWKESWRALEDLYINQREARQKNKKKKKWKKPVIESIGVSNFEIEDMKELVSFARVMPSIYQGNLWSVLHDPYLVNLLNENNIHFQAYNIMNGALQRKSEAPKSFSVLTKLAADLTSRAEDIDKPTITEAMVLMAWLVQEGIAVIPRSSSSIHQVENSPVSIGSVPKMSYEEKVKVKNAVSALMKGVDLTVEATFQNNSPGPVAIHWKNTKTGEEIQVLDAMEPGVSKMINTHPGHQFVVYSEGKKSRQQFGITAFYGEEEEFNFDEL